MNKIHIYPIDEDSVQWCVTNELVGDKIKNSFVILNWTVYESRIRVTILISSGESFYVEIPKDKLLKLTRSVKLKGLIDSSEKVEVEKKRQLNQKRFESLKETCIKNKELKSRIEKEKFEGDRKYSIRNEKRKCKSYYNEYYGCWVTKRLKGNLKDTRKRLAKENKGCGKSKNR